MRLAARHPELVRTVTLMNTTPEKEILWNRIRYGFLAQMVKLVGPGPFTPIAVKELFGRTTRHDPAQHAMLEAWTAKLRARPRNIAHSLLAVMNRLACTSELDAIRCPTLVIAGEDDSAQPPRNSTGLVAGIRGSRLVRIPAAGHSSSLEQPDAVITAMSDILKSDLAARTVAHKVI